MKDITTLKKMAYQLFHILDGSQRREMVGMLLLIFVGALFELLGVSSIMPFINAIINPQELIQNPVLSIAINSFHISDNIRCKIIRIFK